MAGTLSFKREEVKRILDHLDRCSSFGRMLGDPEGEPGKPHVVLVHDDGVYLLSNGDPRDLVDEDRCFCAYAKGMHPRVDPDFYEVAIDVVGGDDFAEGLDPAAVRRAYEGGGDVRIKVTPKTISVLVRETVPAPARPAAPLPGVPYVNALCRRKGDRVEYSGTVGTVVSVRGLVATVVSDPDANGKRWRRKVLAASLRPSDVPAPAPSKAFKRGDKVVVEYRGTTLHCVIDRIDECLDRVSAICLEGGRMRGPSSVFRLETEAQGSSEAVH